MADDDALIFIIGLLAFPFVMVGAIYMLTLLLERLRQVSAPAPSFSPASVIFERDEQGNITAVHYLPPQSVVISRDQSGRITGIQFTQV